MNAYNKATDKGYSGHRFEGSFYDSNMSTKTVAKNIRHEIKELKSDGVIPSALKISVRYRSYSGGSSIDIRVQNFAEVAGFAPYGTFHNELDHWGEPTRRMVGAASYLFDLLSAIVVRYKMDDSDSQVDYFHTNFYDHIIIED